MITLVSFIINNNFDNSVLLAPFDRWETWNTVTLLDLFSITKCSPRKLEFESPSDSQAFLWHRVLGKCCVGLRRRMSSPPQYTGWVSHPYVRNYLWGAFAALFGTKRDTPGNGQTANDPLIKAERRNLEAQDKAILAGNRVKAHWASPYPCRQFSRSLPGPVASGRGGDTHTAHASEPSIGQCSGINQLWRQGLPLIRSHFGWLVP